MRRPPLALLLALPLSLAAGGFKRLYPARAGLRVTELKALPGGAVAITLRAEADGTESHRLLLAGQARSFSSGAGAIPLIGEPDGRLVWQVGGDWLIRTSTRSGLRRQPAGDSLPAAPRETDDRFTFDGERLFWRHSGEKKLLFENQPRETLVEWGRTNEFGWVVVRIRRELPGLPPKREIRLFSATDGHPLASTVVGRESPEKNLAVAFQPDGPGRPGALAVISGGHLEWWSPSATDLDDWGEVTIDPAKAVAAEAPKP